VKSNEAVYIYDFETTAFLRKIDVLPNQVVWNENKKTVALICDETTYILKVYPDKIHQYIEENENANIEDEGCVDGFEACFEINDKIINGLFNEDVFIFLNSKNKINYSLEDRVFSITTLNNNFSLLGYLSSLNKLFLMNKQFQLVSYSFPLSFINYQMAILKKDFEAASKIFPTMPVDYLEKVTNFLEKFDYYDLSYKITTNPTHKFSLAIKLNKIRDAYDLVKESPTTEKWKMLADLAISSGEFKIAEEAMLEGKDFNGLLLYYSW
jgi:coatomer subunit beta'